MRMFLAAIQHLVGDYAIVRSSDVSDAASVPTSFVRELEALRAQVEVLSDEVRQLILKAAMPCGSSVALASFSRTFLTSIQNASLSATLDQRTAESSTMRSLPTAATGQDEQVRLVSFI